MEQFLGLRQEPSIRQQAGQTQASEDALELQPTAVVRFDQELKLGAQVCACGQTQAQKVGAQTAAGQGGKLVLGKLRRPEEYALHVDARYLAGAQQAFKDVDPFVDVHRN